MVGESLKQYSIESLLGRGGMGAVYRARDTRLNRAVAIKVLSADVTADPDRRRRFMREAQAAAAVTHPAIAQIYDVDEQDGVIFIAMELVEGKTARQLVAGRELDLLGALDVATQVAEGLGKAHEAGIVHRDVKSDNVMVTPEGHAKLLDFGLAKLVEPEVADGADAADTPTVGVSTAQTQAGMVLGTIAYMSPEQARGRAVDHRSDIFSLGVMIYELATGQMPFAGASPLDTMHAIAFEESRPVTEIKPGLPPDLQRIISRCLRKRPQDRYQSTRELADDLKRLRADTESGKTRALPLSQKVADWMSPLRHVRLGGAAWIVGAVLVGAGAAIVLLYATSGKLGSLVLVALVLLWAYRHLRRQRVRVLQKVVGRLRRNPAVKLVQCQGQTLTVAVDQTDAAIFPKIHELVDDANRRLYFGDDLAAAIRDDLTVEELRTLLQQPGVLYVRKDVLDSRPPAMPSVPPPPPPDTNRVSGVH